MTSPQLSRGAPTEGPRSSGCRPGSLALLGIVLAVVAVLAWAGWGLLVTPGDGPFGGAAFDRDSWRAGTREVRTPMARAAVEELRPGLLRVEVLDLLGEPDAELDTQAYAGHFGESFPDSARQTLRYELESSSQTSFRGLDDAFLYVHLNAAGRVVRAEIGGG